MAVFIVYSIMHHYVTEQSWHASALVQESTKMSPIAPNDYTPFIIIYMYTYINNSVLGIVKVGHAV